MISSGIRIGAWDYLRWKDIIPASDANGEIIAARVRVYADDSEQYYTFITPQAYASLKDWIDFRISYGEKINADSWVMRDIWQTTNMKYGARLGLVTFPKKLKSSGIKHLLERALWEQGLRHTPKEKERRHEWKAAHGFRKFYKTHAEQVMKPINVEITMGHEISVSSSCYKPTEREVLEDYLKAVSLLTINGENIALQKQIKELTEKTSDNTHLLNAKLQEKELFEFLSCGVAITLALSNALIMPIRPSLELITGRRDILYLRIFAKTLSSLMSSSITIAFAIHYPPECCQNVS